MCKACLDNCTGVMWSCYLEALTTMPTLFWTFWRLHSSSLVTSLRGQVQKLSHNVTSETIALLVYISIEKLSYVSKVVICRFGNVWYMCRHIHIGSKTAPGLRTDSLQTGTIIPLLVLLGIEIVAHTCGIPIIRPSVLSAFSLSLFWDIVEGTGVGTEHGCLKAIN